MDKVSSSLLNIGSRVATVLTNVWGHPHKSCCEEFVRIFCEDCEEFVRIFCEDIFYLDFELHTWIKYWYYISSIYFVYTNTLIQNFSLKNVFFFNLGVFWWDILELRIFFIRVKTDLYITLKPMLCVLIIT